MNWLKFRMMIGLGPSIKLAECKLCHTLTLPGSHECLNCKAAFPENCVINKITVQDPDEMVEVFLSCPGCGRLLKPGTETCPECGAAITREYAARSIEANVTVTRASILAEHIESLKPAAFIALPISALCLLVFPVPWLFLLMLAMPMLEFLTIMHWLRRFGSYQSGDEEFAAARGKVKGALWLWLAVIVVQTICLAASWLLW